VLSKFARCTGGPPCRVRPIRLLAISFQVDGNFGGGGKVVIKASSDGRIYETVNDRRRYPVLVDAPWLRTIPVKAAYVRPRVYGGDEATSITVTAVFRKPR